jgi:hypothetical protein
MGEPIGQRAIEIIPQLTRVCGAGKLHHGSRRFNELLRKAVPLFTKEKSFAADYRIVVDIHVFGSLKAVNATTSTP